MQIAVIGARIIGGTLARQWAAAGHQVMFGVRHVDNPATQSLARELGAAVVEGLIQDVGLRPVRLGDLSQVGLVDAIGSLWFALAFGQGMGRNLAFKVLTR